MNSKAAKQKVLTVSAVVGVAALLLVACGNSDGSASQSSDNRPKPVESGNPQTPAPQDMVMQVPPTSSSAPAKIGSLVTPNGVVEINTLTEPDSVVSGTSKLVPSKGQKFLGVIFHFYDNSATNKSLNPADFSVCNPQGSADQTGLSVNIEGKQTAINQSGNGQQAYVLSVPERTDQADLVVTTKGVSQSISLLNGKPQKTDVNETLAQLNRVVSLPAATSSKSVSNGDYKASYDLKLDGKKSVALCPFDAARGWAPDGRSWLKVSAIEGRTGGIIYETLSSFQEWKVAIDGKEYGPTTVHEDGSSAYATDGLDGFFVGNPTSLTAYFEIPSATKSVSGVLVTKLEVKADGEAVTHNPSTLTYAGSPVTFTANFS